MDTQFIVEYLQLGADFADGAVVHHHQFLKLEGVIHKVRLLHFRQYGCIQKGFL